MLLAVAAVAARRACRCVTAEVMVAKGAVLPRWPVVDATSCHTAHASRPCTAPAAV